MDRDNHIIEETTEHKKQTLLLIGSLDGNDAKYELQRNKITVLNTKEVTVKKFNSVRPKGDIELKNITYRPKEKRYIGRKQIFNQRITVYAKTQAECLNKLNAEIRKIKSDFQIGNFKTKLSVLDYWNKWYAENKEPFLADKTKEDYQIVKRKFSPLHHLPLTKLTKETLLAFFKTLEENRTKEKVITLLRAMLDTAEKEGKIKRNPFATIVTKMKKRPPKPAFTYEQQVKIVEGLKGTELEPIILTYLTTGLRRNELDFKNIENNIQNNILTAVNLKGRDREVRYKKIKLSQSMVDIIMNNLDIFHKYNSRLALDHFSEFLKSIGVEGSIVTCRHTFATNCFYLGKDKLIIAREMGHKSAQITDTNYIEIDYNLSREKIIKLYNNLYNLN